MSSFSCGGSPSLEEFKNYRSSVPTICQTLWWVCKSLSSRVYHSVRGDTHIIRIIKCYQSMRAVYMEKSWARKDLIKDIFFNIEQCIGVFPGEGGGEEGKHLHDFLSKALWKGLLHLGIRWWVRNPEGSVIILQLHQVIAFWRNFTERNLILYSVVLP